MDTPTREELLAADVFLHPPAPLRKRARRSLSRAARTLEEIRLFLGADSVGYLSLESLRRAVGDTNGSFCTSCYTGVYPTEGVQLEVSPRRAAPEEAANVPQEASRHEP